MMAAKTQEPLLETLDPEGLQHFFGLQAEAVRAVSARFYATHGAQLERYGARGQEACREDLAFHLEFLTPVLEFGLLQPMVDYLHWLHEVLTARAVPTSHLGLSLEWLAEFFAERMEPSAGTLVATALRTARSRFETAIGTPCPPIHPHPEPWPEAAAFEAALLGGHRRQAIAVMQRCLQRGAGLVDFELHVIQPALYAIGAQWQLNQVSVAQEHLATAIAQSVMALALQSAQPAAAVDKRVVLACVEGNHHALGLQMIADAFLIAGWDVQLLGADVPSSALLQHIAAWRPDLVGLSVSLPQQVRVARAFITQLIARFGADRPAVMIGGLACNRLGALANVIGADTTGADARAAVKSAHGVLDGWTRA